MHIDDSQLQNFFQQFFFLLSISGISSLSNIIAPEYCLSTEDCTFVELLLFLLSLRINAKFSKYSLKSLKPSPVLAEINII